MELNQQESVEFEKTLGETLLLWTFGGLVGLLVLKKILEVILPDDPIHSPILAYFKLFIKKQDRFSIWIWIKVLKVCRKSDCFMTWAFLENFGNRVNSDYCNYSWDDNVISNKAVQVILSHQNVSKLCQNSINTIGQILSKNCANIDQIRSKNWAENGQKMSKKWAKNEQKLSKKSAKNQQKMSKKWSKTEQKLTKTEQKLGKNRAKTEPKLR